LKQLAWYAHVCDGYLIRWACPLLEDGYPSHLPERIKLMGNVTDPDKPKSDMIVIRDFFFEGVKTSVFGAEYKQLDGEAKKELADGIRNGTFTY